MSLKILIAALFSGINCTYLIDKRPEFIEHLRERRQVQLSAGINNKGNLDLGNKVPLVSRDGYVLSATGSATLDPTLKLSSYGAGVALDNINGYGISLSGKEIPDFGQQLKVAGNLNILNTPANNLDTDAFFTSNIPSIPNMPIFNTYGGGLGYTYQNKIGASLGVSYNDLQQKTDLSAMGKYNLFNTPTSSLNFGAGATRSFSPYILNSMLEPKFHLKYTTTL